MSETLTEDELISRAANGDEHAIKRLLLSYYDPMLRHIESRMPDGLQSNIAAEDLLQQTYSDVFRSVQRFIPQTPSSFASWLRSIADGRIRNANRELNTIERSGLHQQASTSKGGPVSEDCADTPKHSSSFPMTSPEPAELVDALLTTTAEMGADQRRTRRVRRVEGKVVHRSPVGAFGLLQRAKRALGRSSKLFRRQ